MSRPQVVEPQELELARYVRTGDTVTWGQACAEPVELTSRLMAQRASIGPFRCFLGISLAGTVEPAHADVVTFLSYCGTGGNRRLAEAGVLDVVPCHYSGLPRLLSDGPLAVDVLLLKLPPPNRRGEIPLGLADEYLGALVDRARVVIAEVSDRVPRTVGGRVLTESDIDVLVPSDRAPVEFLTRPPTAVEHRIGARVAELVPDGATIQMGVGSLPRAVLGALAGHADLGIHSGLIADGVADLVERGVVTGARKTLDRGQVVTGMIMGSARLFDFVDENPVVRLAGTDYTHAPGVLDRLDRFVALNSAVEVDLSGQINAEVAGGSYVGAVGGAVDFFRGSSTSRDGLPIVALPSTAGERSRIVTRLSGPVSTARSDAGIVVTEHGVADLRGQPLSRRRDLLLALADPSHRDALERTAPTSAA